MIVAREDMHDAVADVFLRHARPVEPRRRAARERVHVEDERLSGSQQQPFHRRLSVAPGAHDVTRLPGIPRRELELAEHVFLESDARWSAAGDSIFDLVNRPPVGFCGNFDHPPVERPAIGREAEVCDEIVAVLPHHLERRQIFPSGIGRGHEHFFHRNPRRHADALGKNHDLQRTLRNRMRTG